MTLEALVAEAARLRIRLEARGDRLHVEAPTGAVTPMLREALAEHKPELLARLAPPEFVTMRGGLVLPVPAVRLALDLEQRGFRMALDEHEQFTIEPSAELTDDERAAIQRWRLHLGAIVGYDAEAHERT